MIYVMSKPPSRFRCLLFLALLLTQTGFADNVQTSGDTLLDRIQIEDLISNYYWDMNSDSRHELSEYYAEGAVLDVNGIVYEGHTAIQSAYGGGEGNDEDGGGDSGRIHMLMNNPKIRVNGHKAVAEVIWTGVISETVRLAPRLFEQGREYSELVKKDGRWLFSKRVITSDSGLPANYDAYYRER